MAVHFTSDHAFTVWGQYDFFSEKNVYLKSNNKDINNGETQFQINYVILNWILRNYNKTNIFKKYIKQYNFFNTQIIIVRNLFSWASNHHRMFSVESCDTEDWTNGYWIFIFAITGIIYI